ncbi:MAG: Flp pilus assembly complex ATPase component TadA [Nitrospiraceae bacterium]|nr:Flp pilus assembly complex ATPase component TadA [Nitrospiraceae bacterium]
MLSKELNLKLGDILIQQGIITKEQLKTALAEQKAHPSDQKRIGSYLIDLGYLTEEDITKALGIQFNLPVMTIEGMRIKSEVIDLVTENMAKKFNIMPLFKIEDELTVAISDPTDITLLDIISSETGHKVVPVMAVYSEITKAINKNYSRKIESLIAEPQSETKITAITRSEIDALRLAGGEMPIVKIVDRILIEAVEEGASDIHIEPSATKVSVRFRVDGILHEYTQHPVRTQPGIVSRIKILSSLNIAERQKPQDGRIQIKMDKDEMDIRVSILPTFYGEKVVMRLLHRDAVRVKIDDLGFSEKNLAAFLDMIREPYGIILVTGPTGSGKTTTLYAALNEVNSITKNIITVEDPIEYQLPIINQVQVNPKKDLTFANALRTILRQDPDIIMIGEIRDPETAAIAAESALTGHLVFSTLHTNDAPSSITRLTDMGVEPFLLAPSLLGILAQRLVRKICPKCKQDYTPTEIELNAIGFDSHTENIKFYKGMGCDNCKHTGYKGRSGIHEILVVDEKIRELITNKASVNILREEATKKGFKDMRFDGIKKIIAGDTTVEEVLRATRDIK